jgi:type II secretory pathway pseudopilin PulG
MKKLGQIGDTIVEVLIVLVIISLVIVGAFLSTNRSLVDTRQSEERSVAVKYAQQQIERLKAGAASLPSGDFCLKDDGTTARWADTPGLSLPQTDPNQDSLSNYPAACKQMGPSGLYYQWISYDSSNPDSVNSLVIRIRWPKTGGTGTNQVQIAIGQGLSAGSIDSPPTTPSGLTATAVSSSQINLSWNASTDTDSTPLQNYLIERCQGSGCTSFAQVGSTAGTATNYNDTGLSANITYRYQVRAQDTATPTSNKSGYSNIAEATTMSAADTQAPSIPANLTASAVSASQINLTWTASTDNVGVTSYRVERCQGSSCSNFLEIASPSTNSFNNTGLSSSTSYRYRVRATDAANNLSGYSSIASATTQASGPPPGPTTFSCTGAAATYQVPAGVTRISIDVVGANGATDGWGDSTPGRGGRVQHTNITVTPGETLSIRVGCRGTTGVASGAAGGFNGGGNAGRSDGSLWSAGSGGGASDIRRDSNGNGQYELSERIVVAGGGGGAATYYCSIAGEGGNAGGASGSSGGTGSCGPSSYSGRGGGGGTQFGGGTIVSSGYNGTNGALGVGGNGGGSSTAIGGGGGGGGYYGGAGGGGALYEGGGGGGGSSYCAVAGATFTAGFTPLNDSTYQNNGRIIITPM